jgi:opacity protein-like surface antigen
MRFKACAVFLIVFVVLSSQLLAFNGLRKGFILGGGGGPGYLTYEGVDKFSLATNFKIGYAPSNSFEIYYLNTVSWFGVYSETFLNGLTGLGLTKYIKPEGRGFFVFGGVGLAVLQVLTQYGDSDTGLGLIGGVGYDISKHWSVQGDILYTTFDSGAWHSLGVRVTINFLAF